MKKNMRIGKAVRYINPLLSSCRLPAPALVCAEGCAIQAPSWLPSCGIAAFCCSWLIPAALSELPNDGLLALVGGFVACWFKLKRGL